MVSIKVAIHLHWFLWSPHYKQRVSKRIRTIEYHDIMHTVPFLGDGLHSVHALRSWWLCLVGWFSEEGHSIEMLVLLSHNNNTKHIACDGHDVLLCRDGTRSSPGLQPG